MDNTHFRRWGAVYLLLALFIGSWIGQFFAMTAEITNEAVQHGQEFQWVEFWPRFWSATFENWQSEWLQLFVQAAVLLGLKHLLFKADAEDSEQMQLDLAEIKERLGIPPRDEVTAQAQADLERTRRTAGTGGPAPA